MIHVEAGYFRSLFVANKFKILTNCSVFWSFGMCVGFLGPTLWDLGCNTGTSIPNMAWLFFSQSLLMLLGSISAGLLNKIISPHPLLLACLCGIAITLIMVPICETLYYLGLVLAIMGFSMGIIDTTANVSMIKIFGADCSPFLQALHFFYGFGAFLSPLIAEPFLQNFDCTSLLDNSTETTGWIEKSMQNMDTTYRGSVELPNTLEGARNSLRISHAFWIMAVLQIPIIVGICSLIFVDLYGKKSKKYNIHRSYQDMDNSEKDKHNDVCLLPCAFESSIMTLIVLISAFLLFFADGIQAIFGSYVFSYGKLTEPGLVIADAAYVNAGFWGMFAFGRLLSIFISVHLSAGLMLVIDVAGSLLSVSTIYLFPTSLTALYIGTWMLGFFLSSVYPSTISISEQFVDIGPSATSIIVVGAATGEMIYPLFIGQLLDANGPWVFPFYSMITVFFMAIMLLALLITGFRMKGNAFDTFSMNLLGKSDEKKLEELEVSCQMK